MTTSGKGRGAGRRHRERVPPVREQPAPRTDQTRPHPSMEERLAPAFAIIDPWGPFTPSDHKRIMDELWGEEEEGADATL